MKKNIYVGKQEKGVVLLSCLVFLLILLGIIRFTMTSSRLEERKAGADLEMLTARQSADTALRAAERFILEQGRQLCLKDNSITLPPGKTQGKYCDEQNKVEWANTFWSKENSSLDDAFTKVGAKNLLNKGIYTQQYVIAQNFNTRCRPFWICIDWSENANQVKVTGKQLDSAVNVALPSIECKECSTISGLKPRYIIERFLAKEINAMDFPDLAAGTQLKSGDVVVFRITAIGFGNGGGSNNVKTTNAVMQAIYLLNG
ncbi:pilus assembly PilX family protein [Cardiobacterium valvarum]|uniref:PilX/PilW C-terminal domain-containing protein n=1 Tax=Cardiobacterium valvarum F0432 TaxID=797473 RepID=G9ZI46_9GAMM|nr:hypothetical protein [Cardiobacterium valvarum]EHM52205.1 hypothetical protein HMPREF9080_02455 [Cardiobacterium valvarum F0432]